MPNHVINEIIFRNVDVAKQNEMLVMIRNGLGEVDFEILVPIPINVWRGSVGEKHEKAFRQNALDWARLNWGTKWNAYEQKPIERTDDTLILRFKTAWGPPYGWLCAIFNFFKLPFEHNWLSEGHDRGVCGKFNWSRMDDLGGEPWNEEPADEAMHRHLHKLLWGVEEFSDEDAA